MREIKKMADRGMIDTEKDDPFELFISATNIRFAYYKDSHKIIGGFEITFVHSANCVYAGNTFGMCVLQDFEAITPNILARTIETVEGGGLVVILLRTMSSLKQLYSLTMVLTTTLSSRHHD